MSRHRKTMGGMSFIVAEGVKPEPLAEHPRLPPRWWLIVVGSAMAGAAVALAGRHLGAW